MKISIIIITYRVEAYLERCLESVIAQDMDELEIIIVLGHSKTGDDDGCGDICSMFAACDERIRVINCQAAGVSDARNRGLAAATGDLIGFVDADDYIDRDMFSSMRRLMVENEADIAVCGRYYEYKNITEKDEPGGEPRVMGPEEALEMVLSGGGFYLHCWDKLYKRELWEGISFPEDAYVEDRVTVNRILGRAGRIVYDRTPRYHYRERLQSMSKSGSVAENNHRANQELSVYIKQNFPSLASLTDRYMLYETITAVQNVYLAGGGRREAAPFLETLSSMREVARHNPLVSASLRLKYFLALHAPFLLAANTRRKMRRLEEDKVRFT